MDPFTVTVSDEFIARERNKAREVRQSQWWRNKLGNGKCYYCERLFHPDDLSMDHKTPIIRGGRSTRNNLVPACKECNNEKKYFLLGEWIAKRREEGRPLACARYELY